MEIQFIGTGNAFNMGGRAHQAIWLRTKDKNILLDCGATTPYQMQNLSLDSNELDAILFTHFHGDHFAGLVFLDLGFTIVKQRKREIIYAGPEKIQEKFQKSYELFYQGFDYESAFPRNFTEFQPSQTYSLFEGIEVQTFAMFHSPESMAYRITVDGKVIAFTGDTGWVDNLEPLAADADLLICECDTFRKTPYPKHLSYEEIISKKNLLQAKKILFTHVGEEMQAHEHESEIEIAKDGLIVSL